MYYLWTAWTSYRMNQKPRFQFTAVSGFFQHDKEPEGPQFRAVSL